MAYFSGLGLGGTLLPGVVWAGVREQGTITREVLEKAEKISGLAFTDEQREMMLEGLNSTLRQYESLREHEIPNSVAPALHFDPVLPGMTAPAQTAQTSRMRHTRDEGVAPPSRLEDVAFWPVTLLSELVRSRGVSSLDLTRMYLDRLKRHGPRLECVVSLTEELALDQAHRADRELEEGRWRGPLHGIPWGAKDLLSTTGYRTTWGAKPFEDQVLDEDATVVRRLEEAGAVLVAKLTLGALAWGDVWYGGMTRNPWNPEQGSSGSSAGPAAATAAGLVGFSIGSETLGSIVSPATRCGVTGLRPTFGRVSRHGAMALSWSMDKLGPMCRGVEDCALVLDAIRGADEKDATARDVAFDWDVQRDPRSLRVGYLRSAFEQERDTKALDDDVLETLRSLGIELKPMELPQGFPLAALSVILNAEAAAAFDELTRSGRDALLVRQVRNAWPNAFREARMIPAVEYIQANRVRTQVMAAFDEMMEGLDLFVAPSFAPDLLQMTNLTGHPVVVLPNGFDDSGAPVSISFVGKLWGEAEVMTVAKAYQDASGFHILHPPRFI